ncbi:hypothetical protein MNB_SUP05-SYMBIONT-7-135 [hydrothermal vent metagenome]|uniref:Uncharacterized protein n=1 Tax=hydrothermal vent metagenome TaxID=652676 RepID=A0A1W1E4I8_9ZZZZ
MISPNPKVEIAKIVLSLALSVFAKNISPHCKGLKVFTAIEKLPVDDVIKLINHKNPTIQSKSC